jgi:nicotinamide mononucleotide transporter
MSPVTSLLEWIGTAFGILSVYLTVKQNLWCWPTGIISVIAFLVLFYEVKLYVDAALQVFFLVLSIQGWYGWVYGGTNKTELPVSHLNSSQTIALGAALLVCIGLTGYVFDNFTDAHIPFWDATASGLSVAAQLLLVRKKVENWYLWIAVDILSIGIYFYKTIYVTAGLYVVFLFLAISGLREWQRTLKSRPLTEMP